MSVSNTMIDDLYVGEYKELARIISDFPTGLSLETIWFTIKEDTTKTDAQAIVKKIITTTLSVDGQITDAGTNNIAKYSIFLNKADTEKLKARKTYLVDAWAKVTGLEPVVMESGVIMAQPAVTLDRV